MNSLTLLDYEREIVLQAFQESALVVMARGLGLDRIFCSFLQHYCTDAGSLVLALNTSAADEEHFCQLLLQAGISQLPKNITSDIGADERRNKYLEGGVFFVTSRILVVDLLTARVPVELITGILVYRAHKVVETCQEAFILRLFREKNKTGFIRGFTDNPESFTYGFCKVEKVLKTLFVPNLFLWPRFQVSISNFLQQQKNRPEVIELQIPMTASMQAIQTSLLDIISACVQELRSTNSELDMEEVTVENAISKAFDRICRMQLDPIWHQLNEKTKRLVADLKDLRNFLWNLTHYDCVTFLNTVSALRQNEKLFGQNAGWLFLDAANNLFVHSRKRVYVIAEPKRKKRKADSVNVDTEPSETIVDLEIPPKWKALSDILGEIEKEAVLGVLPVTNGAYTLICAEDDHTCEQLRKFLSNGAEATLSDLYNRTIATKQGKTPLNVQDKAKTNDKSSSIKAKNNDKLDNATLTQMVRAHSDDNENSEPTASTGEQKQNANHEEIDVCPSHLYRLADNEKVVLHPLHGRNNAHYLTQVLYELQPRYIVFYDVDLQFIRQVEVFKASRPNMLLKVYFMMYADSADEQRHLTTIRREKEAFEFLIKEKATIVIPTDVEGLSNDNIRLERGSISANQTTSTRKGGTLSKELAVQQKILVDMREFRSELPSLIHRRGVEVEPLTLEIGDYILTPDICVERKSVSDLIGSLNNGRLYTQCLAMTRYYSQPLLLIEFDQNKPFSLQFHGKTSTMSGEIQSTDVLSKLTLLTIHFPNLRILWCATPYATAELFEEIKIGKDQPDIAKAKTIVAESQCLGIVEDKYSHRPRIVLQHTFHDIKESIVLLKMIVKRITLKRNQKLLTQQPLSEKLYSLQWCKSILNDGPIRGTSRTDLILKLPGISSKNYKRILNNVENLVKLVGLSEEKVSDILQNQTFGKMLYEFLHKEKEENITKKGASYFRKFK